MICTLFRHTQITIGNQASYADIADCINKKARAMSDLHLQTTFNLVNIYRWFKQQQGKEKSPKEQPYLTDDQRKVVPMNGRTKCHQPQLGGGTPTCAPPKVGTMPIMSFRCRWQQPCEVNCWCLQSNSSSLERGGARSTEILRQANTTGTAKATLKEQQWVKHKAKERQHE